MFGNLFHQDGFKGIIATTKDNVLMKKEEKREERQAKHNSFLHREKESMNEQKTPTERERYYFHTDFSNGQILKTTKLFQELFYLNSVTIRHICYCCKH